MVATGRFLRAGTKSMAIALFLGLAGFVGFLLPSELRPYVPALRWIDGLLSVFFGVLSWEFFRLAVPARCFYSRKWQVLQFLSVPLIWTVLVVVFAVCLGRIHDQWPYFNEVVEMQGFAQ